MKKPGRTLEIRVPIAPGAERTAREAVASFAARLGFDAEKIEDIKTAVNEACLNAIEHSFGAPAEEILVRLAGGEDSLLIEVVNTGKAPVLPNTVPDIKEKMEGRDRPRGWGVYLMRELADEVEFKSEHDVTTVTMKFRQ